MTAKLILDIINPIPKEKFITGVYGNYKGQSCFLGHIHRHFNKNEYYGDENGYGARELTRKFLTEQHGLVNVCGAHVNNYPDINGYTEPEIKDRVVHMLNDMIKAGY